MSDDDDTVGGQSLIEIVKEKKYLLAPFRLARFEALYAKYEAGQPLGAEQQFILRCAADVLDNPAS